jgi:hypothetical protein
MQIPRLDKIVLNMGVGEAVADSKKPALRLKTCSDRRSEGCHYACPQVDCRLQGA